MSIKFKSLPLAVAAATVLLEHGLVQAQSLILEEVIVTAQKRAQGLQNVPIAISAVTGEKIDELGIRDLEEVALYTPNVTINQGQASPNLFIRGIGSGTNAGFEQSVGLYVDGIYSGRGELANVPFLMDIERVEILKGPQGTLFGKNTIAGAINVTTAKPSDDFVAYVDTLYEPDHHEAIYTGVISGPLSDTLSGRVSMRHSAMDGWVENTTLNNWAPDNKENFVRGALSWNNHDDLEVLAKYEYGEFQRNGSPREIYQTTAAGLSIYPDAILNNKSQLDFEERSEARTETGSITVNYQLGDITLTSITGYSTYDRDRSEDVDASPNAALGRLRTDDYEQLSQEVRFVSPEGETIDWIAGVYWQDAQLRIQREFIDFDLTQIMGGNPTNLLVAPLQLLGDERAFNDFDQTTTSSSAFTQVTWNASDTLRFTGGLRFDDETKELNKSNYLSDEFNGLGIAGVGAVLPINAAAGILVGDLRTHTFSDLERNAQQWTGSFNIQWDVSPDIMTYFSASSGFKAGGYDEAYSGSDETVRVVALASPTTVVANADTRANDSSVLEYDDETVLSFELGAKMALLEGTAELNVALFRSDFEDMQVSALVGDAFRVSNAGESVSQGLEVDGRWRLTESWAVSGSLAYLDATYEKFDTAPCTVPQALAFTGSGNCTQDLEGQTLLYSPEWSANLSLDYVVVVTDNLELRSVLDINYQDEFYSALDLDPNTLHDAATKVNLRVALRDAEDSWSVALIGKNLTDKETTNFNNDVAFSATGTYFGITDRPRTLAIQGRYRF
jgi:iron complex outermembrane recepter protein